MPTYRLVVEYDGTDFAGLQFQPGERTIAGEVERALGNLFVEPIHVTSAGRTDAGVHASGQVLSFRAERSFPTERLGISLNANLPPDISVRHAELAPERFSARFDALRRTYEYRVFNRPLRSARDARFAHHVYKPVDRALLADAARDLLGQHDFVSFCGVLPDRGTTVRTIHAIDVRESEGATFVIAISGLGFLHRMVRIGVGTLLEIATGRRAPGDIPAILAARDRKRAGYTAPACGLTLTRVDYDGFSSAS